MYVYVAACDGATIDDGCGVFDLTNGTALTVTEPLRERGYLKHGGAQLVPS